MGGGNWDSSTFRDYTYRTKKVNVTSSGDYTANHQDIFKQSSLAPELDPKNVTRECCDSDEHPNTIPVILALDVTGSMGDAATETAQKLNVIMTDLYTKVKDVEFMIMGIGDFVYDRCPLQVSQFESDIRIAEQLDKVYFEFGGGGNSYESYTAAWYFALHHTKLDCWNRNKRGILITMGDENINPYLPKDRIRNVIGDNLQADVDTKELYKDIIAKYDVHHIYVDHHGWDYANFDTWTNVLDGQHFHKCKIDGIAQLITDIVTSANTNSGFVLNNESNSSSEGISW